MLNVEIQSILFEQIKKESDGYYIIKDTTISLDARVIIDENGKMRVYGKGSKKCNTYIKDCIERYKRELKELNNRKEAIKILLQDIETKSKNKITFEKVIVFREDGKIKCYAWVFKSIDGYLRRIGTMSMDANTYEIENYRASRETEDMNKFIDAYNKYINPEESEYKNKIIEVIEDVGVRKLLYKALREGNKIGYTTNLRGIPQAVYSNDEQRLYVIINPDEHQEAYIDKYIIPIDKAIESYYGGFIYDLRRLYYSNIDEFRQTVKEDSQVAPLTQYHYLDIVRYLEKFYRLEQEWKID